MDNQKTLFEKCGARVLVTGGTGLIGQNLTDFLISKGLPVTSAGNHRGEVRADLRDPRQAAELFDRASPAAVFHLAARVGGIYANVHNKAAFYSENTQINVNVVNEIARRRVPFVFAMGTGCAYPKRLEGQELREEDFLDGKPEPTNDAYAYAKRNLLVHLEALRGLYDVRYVYAIPANIYGPYDNFHPTDSHVVPGLIRRFVESRDSNAPEISVWGGGGATRDFLYIGDLIEAIWMICQAEDLEGPVNIATGEATSIRELANTLQELTGYRGRIQWDSTKPEGQMGRRFSGAKMAQLGWKPRTSLREGLRATVAWFEENYSLATGAQAGKVKEGR